MAAINPCVFLQGGAHPAKNVRQMTRGIVPSAGVAAPGDLAVSQNGTPDMSVNVSAGGVFVPGTRTATQGVYFCWNDGTVNVALDPSDSTNARIDLIVARVSDKEYDAGNTDTWSIAVVKGTVSGNPAEPSLPADAWKLAAVRVNANAASITNADISGSSAANTMQNRATALGGVRVVNGVFPTAVAGEVVYNLADGLVYTSDGIGWTPTPGSQIAILEGGGDAAYGSASPERDVPGWLEFTMPYLAPGRRLEIDGFYDLNTAGATLHDVNIVRLTNDQNATLALTSTVVHGVFSRSYNDDPRVTAHVDNGDFAAGTLARIKARVTQPSGTVQLTRAFIRATVV